MTSENSNVLNVASYYNAVITYQNGLIKAKIEQFKQLEPTDEQRASLILEIKNLIEQTQTEFPNVYTLGYAVKFAIIKEDIPELLVQAKLLHQQAVYSKGQHNVKIEATENILDFADQLTSISAYFSEIVTLAEPIVKEYLDEFPDSVEALKQLMIIFRCQINLEAEAAVVRKILELSPELVRIKLRLVSLLLALANQATPVGSKISGDDERVLEAKNLLLELYSVEPRNLFVLMYLIMVEKMQNCREAVKYYSARKLEIIKEEEALKNEAGVQISLGTQTGEAAAVDNSEYEKLLLSFFEAFDKDNVDEMLAIIKLMFEIQGLDEKTRRKIKTLHAASPRLITPTGRVEFRTLVYALRLSNRPRWQF